jgi:hypothetical protein
MRRAELAGRERAESLLRGMQAFYGSTPAERIKVALADEKPHEVYSVTPGEIGAHQLTGRAYTAALEAYDRGYRARLTEALK